MNVIWGAFNVAIGYLLICRVGQFDLRNPIHVSVAGLGALLMATMLAKRFGRFHGGNSAGR